MTNHIPTDEDIRRIEALLGKRISVGEGVVSEIQRISQKEAQKELASIGERILVIEEASKESEITAQETQDSVVSHESSIVELELQIKVARRQSKLSIFFALGLGLVAIGVAWLISART